MRSFLKYLFEDLNLSTIITYLVGGMIAVNLCAESPDKEIDQATEVEEIQTNRGFVEK